MGAQSDIWNPHRWTDSPLFPIDFGNLLQLGGHIDVARPADIGGLMRAELSDRISRPMCIPDVLPSRGIST